MKYMKLPPGERESLLSELTRMPDFLEATFAGLQPADTAARGPGNAFSPVEQCWHLADLEREGFGVRLNRLLTEDDPKLADFDGERVAKERNYRSLSLADGIAAFRKARSENVLAFRRVSTEAWARSGTQVGVGRMALCDLPSMMAEHDAAHRGEIEAWVRAFEERPNPR